MNHFIKSIVALCLSTMATIASSAWPEKPINIVLAQAPGGFVDRIARAIAPELEKTLKQPVIINYQPGGNHSVAMNYLVNNQNDGHSFLLIDSGLATNDHPVIHKFRIINIVASSPLIFSAGISGSKEKLMQKIRDRGEISVAVAGLDGAQAIWLSNLESPIKMNLISYKGGAPAMTDTAAGHVEYVTMSMSLTMEWVSTNKIHPLMVSMTTRHPLLPNVPTYNEMGFRGPTGDVWAGFAVPSGISESIVAEFNRALRIAISKENDQLNRLKNNGLTFKFVDQAEANKTFRIDVDKSQKAKLNR